MCECLEYEDGSRFQCPPCAHMEDEANAENRRLRDLLGSARCYFAIGSPMWTAIDEALRRSDQKPEAF